MLTVIRGFSLVEAMIAAFVVVVGMLGLVKLQGQFMASSHNTRVYTEAVNFAQDKQETLRNFATEKEYDHLASGKDSCDPETQDSTCAGLGVTLERSWEVNACPNAVSCKAITTEVQWSEAGAQRKIHLTSYVARTQPALAGLLLAN